MKNGGLVVKNGVLVVGKNGGLEVKNGDLVVGKNGGLVGKNGAFVVYGGLVVKNGGLLVVVGCLGLYVGTLVGKVGLGVVVTNGGLKFLKFKLVFCYIVTDFFQKKKLPERCGGGGCHKRWPVCYKVVHEHLVLQAFFNVMKRICLNVVVVVVENGGLAVDEVVMVGLLVVGGEGLTTPQGT